jgi:hypothetical protein
VLEASNESEIDAAFAAPAQEKPDALIVNPDPYITSRREQIIALVARLSMPSMHSPRDWVVSGALIPCPLSRPTRKRYTHTEFLELRTGSCSWAI